MERVYGSMTLAVFLAALLIVAPESSFARAARPSPLKFTFYFHDNFIPPNVTAVKVATADGNVTSPGRAFSDIVVFDSPLRKGIENDSAVIGHSGGLVEVLKGSVFITLVHELNILNHTGTLTASGMFNISASSWDIGISAGTGSFRGAKGYFTVNIASPNLDDFISKYVATVFLPDW